MQASPQAGAARRSLGIDALRGVAALAVVLTHWPFTASLVPTRPGMEPVSVVPAWVESITHYGQFGVHLFLVISGFCIHLAVARVGASAEVPFVAFWKRRLIRLYPPYFVALVLTILGLLAVFGRTGSGAGLLGYGSYSQLALDLILLLLLCQNLNGASARIGNGPFWSLALEEQLYLLYFGLLWLRKRAGWTGTLATVLLVSMVWRVVGLALDLGAGWMLAGPSRWIEWALGAVAVEAYLGRTQLPPWCSSAPVGVGLLLLAGWLNAPGATSFASSVVADAAFGVAFFVVVNVICAWERRLQGRTPRLLVALAWFGTWSYSLYLTHILVMAGVKQIGLRMGMPVWAVGAARIIAPLVFGYFFYRYVERPFIERARRTAAAARARPAPVPAYT